MGHENKKPGAVVLGSDFKALAVVRSLGYHGIPSVVVDDDPKSAWTSRFVRERVKTPVPMHGEQFCSFLVDMSKRLHLDRWILFPTQDEVVEFVSRHTDQLSAYFQLAAQGWDTLRWACDKRLTYSLAEQSGVPYPATWYPKNVDDLTKLDLPFPVILKPAVSITFQHVTRLKAISVNSYEELLSAYERVAAIIPPDEIMIQEVIPGRGESQFSVVAYCQAGTPLVTMTARRTRQYPVDFGLGSSFVESLFVPDIIDPATRLLQHMGVTGMVEVEFKRDARDASYRLLDINVRPWGWHGLCKSCGIDFPYLHYCELVGDPQPSVPVLYGPRWMRVATDLPAAFWQLRNRELSLGDYIKSLRGTTVFSVFDWKDPLPLISDLTSLTVRAARGAFRRGVPA